MNKILSIRLRQRPLAWLVAAALLGTAFLAVAPRVSSHGEQIAIGEGEKKPVHLSAEQRKLLDVRVASAALRPVSEMLALNGQVQVPAESQGEVSTRISGQVTALYARVGDSVRAGQRLARVQARLVGDPPPSVDIVAPRAGVVDAVEVAVGQAVEPATTLYRLSDRSRLDVVAKVYEEDLGKVHAGQSVAIHTLAYPDRDFSGRVVLVGPRLDPDTRTVDVRIALSDAEGLLRPNLFARASIALREGASGLTVPVAAVLEAAGEKFVFVQQGEVYDRVDVGTGASDDHFVEITKGLVPGDQVVTQGNREIYTQWLTGGVALPRADADD
jgi:cobalt-zinc-cadmium efflux system membrane fusion protein